MRVCADYGRWWVLCTLFVACSGCSAIVDTGNLIIRCEMGDGGPDPCAAAGLICSDGTCQQCKPEPEICDGRDNDCNGKVDEGFDADGDGFTWCGGGHPELADCAPNDPMVHPPRPNPDGTTTPTPEPCDGKDNDCDGMIDEEARCATVRSCSQSGGCRAGLVCNSADDQCVAPRTSGSACKNDAECGSGFCISTAALGLNNVRVDNLCGSACCRDQDCPDKSVCVQSGSGARVCLPLEIAGRQLGSQGGSCRESSACASGVCQSGHCVATCSRSADCDGGETCRLNVTSSSFFSGAGAWICGGRGGLGATGDFCTALNPAACQSALCLGSQCAAPCGSDADCGQGLVCRYVSVQGLLGAGRVTACVPPNSQQSTNSNSQQSMPPGPTCCANTDCSQAQACKPKQANGEWGMYCQGVAVN